MKAFGVDAPETDGVVGPTVRKFVPGIVFRRTLRVSGRSGWTSGEEDVEARQDGPASVGDPDKREDLRRGRECRGTLNDDGDEMTMGICVRSSSDSRSIRTTVSLLFPIVAVDAEEELEGPSTNAGKLEGTEGAEEVEGFASVEGHKVGCEVVVSSWEEGGELRVQLV